MTYYGFEQSINIPTRVTETTISLVDLIYVDDQDDVVYHGTLPQIADHDGVIVSFNVQTEKIKSRTTTTRMLMYKD